MRLSRLRRLYRRVVQSVKQPHDVALRQRCLRDLVTLKRCTPSLPLACTPSVALAEAVQQVVLEVEVEEKQARLKAWKSELRGSEARQVAWVRRRVRRERAAQAPLEKLPAACRMATHPARGVVEQQKVWSGVWSTPAPPVAEVNSMLRALEAHRPSQQTVHIDWSGEALFRLAKSMKCRASGPDDWSASTLTLLPLSWWSEYALLWQQVWSCSKVPSCWRDAKVALLAKEDGSGYRPLSVASVLWRIGAKHMARSLRLWALEWSDQHVFGGVVGRAAKDAVARCIVAAELDPQATFVAQDLSRFFDSVAPEHAAAVADWFRAPPELAKLLLSVYADATRTFALEGHLAPTSTSPCRGLVQGCPLSPLCAAMIMRVWSIVVCGEQTPSPVDAVVYLDDRTFFDRCGGTDDRRRSALMAACNRSRVFDLTFGFACRARKCSVAGRDGSPVRATLAQTFGYPEGTVLDVLGIRFDVADPRTAQLSRVQKDGLSLLLRCIKVAACTMADRKRLIRTLVIPKVTWAAGVAAMPLDFLTWLRREVLRTYGGKVFLQDTPACVAVELLSWDADPIFASCLAALRAACRFCVRSPAWLESLPITIGAQAWPFWLADSVQVVHRLGWSASPDGRTVNRTDDRGICRIFQFGVDSPLILKEWLVEAQRTQVLQATGRVVSSCHRREEEDLAQGNVLPRPQQSMHCSFAAHCELFFEPGASLIQRRAAMSAGGSFWHYNVGRRLGREDPRAACMCGSVFPSRVHLVWACPALAHLRVGLRAPECRTSERLLALPQHGVPPQPQGQTDDGVDALVEHLLKFGQDRAELVVATDGSSKEGVAAWAVSADCQEPIARGLSGEDGTPFRAEVEAIRALLAALLGFCRRSSHRPSVRCYVDCQAAIDIVQGAPGSCPLLSSQLIELRKSVAWSGILVTFLWVPSHGKHVSWKAPDGDSSTHVRALNAAVDEAARACAERRWNGSDRAEWFRRRRADMAWELATVRMATAAVGAYTAHLEQL